jgi:hypothetical protein
VLASNLFWEFETLFYSLNGILLTTVFLALYETGRGWLVLKDVLRNWLLLVPSVATAVLFALVYYNARYLAAGRWLEIGSTGYYLDWLKPADKT